MGTMAIILVILREGKKRYRYKVTQSGYRGNAQRGFFNVENFEAEKDSNRKSYSIYRDEVSKKICHQLHKVSGNCTSSYDHQTDHGGSPNNR